MTIRLTTFTLATLGLLLTGCAERSLPTYEPPLKRSRFMKIRTTAYTHTESDHIPWAANNALGSNLQFGLVRSAAADWARWPAGTRFLIVATGQEYIVDDYGWAISGRNTIDLYFPSAREMNDWGVRRVTVEILEWGDWKKSYRVLQPRAKHAHVRRMLGEMKRFY